MTPETQTIILALRYIARETPGQRTRACMLEAATRLEELEKQIEEMRQCTN